MAMVVADLLLIFFILVLVVLAFENDIVLTFPNFGNSRDSALLRLRY